MGGALQRLAGSSAAEAIMQSMLKRKDRKERGTEAARRLRTHCSQHDEEDWQAFDAWGRKPRKGHHTRWQLVLENSVAEYH